jgi:hypothetical protein
LYLEDIEKPYIAMSELQIFATGTPVIIRGNNFGKLIVIESMSNCSM